MSTVASNLTRDEARERARLLDVESYRVELDLTGDDLTFGSVATISFRCASPGASTFIDLSAPEVREITLSPLIPDTVEMISSVKPSAKYSSLGSGLMFANGSTAIRPWPPSPAEGAAACRTATIR